jgi:hypothetical protein
LRDPRHDGDIVRESDLAIYDDDDVDSSAPREQDQRNSADDHFDEAGEIGSAILMHDERTVSIPRELILAASIDCQTRTRVPATTVSARRVAFVATLHCFRVMRADTW